MNTLIPEINNKKYYKDIMENYEIKFCPKEDVRQLITFLDLNWKKDHIFVKDRILFDWQHFNQTEDCYNFVIAVHKATGDIHAILGFFTSTSYDREKRDSGKIALWPCIWKVRSDIDVKGLGTICYYFLVDNIEAEIIVVSGISEVALGIYKHWNFKTGKMKQYYIINRNIKSYKMLKNVPTDINQAPQCEAGYKLCQQCDFPKSVLAVKHFLNKYKSVEYYVNRYYKHPTYKYLFWELTDATGDLLIILVCRECCDDKENKCIRIVDYIGDINNLCKISEGIHKILIDNDYEYADFLCVGIDDNVFVEAGFQDRDKSEIIIPHYFEPYLQENVYLDYAYKTESDNAVVIVKADGDQDRPNIFLSRGIGDE